MGLPNTKKLRKIIFYIFLFFILKLNTTQLEYTRYQDMIEHHKSHYKSKILSNNLRGVIRQDAHIPDSSTYAPARVLIRHDRDECGSEESRLASHSLQAGTPQFSGSTGHNSQMQHQSKPMSIQTARSTHWTW